MKAKNHRGLAVRLVAREFSAQFSRLFFYMACLAVGVAAIAAVSGLSAQVQATVKANSRLLLGGDVELRDVRYLPEPLVEAVRGDARVASFTRVDEVIAMARPAGDPAADARLVDVHAVSGDFPLVKGSLVVSPEGSLSVESLRGKTVIDKSLAEAWKVGEGGTVDISGSRYVVAGILVDELSRDLTSLALGPRVYVHRDDAVERGLLGRTSRFRERLLLTAKPGTNLATLSSDLGTLARSKGALSVRVTDHERSGSQASRPLRNLGFFLAQVALSTLVLTGLGAASGLAEYLRMRLPDVAIYRALGARPRFPTTVLLGVVTLTAGCGVVAGLAIGEVVRSQVLVPLVGGFLPMGLEPASTLLAGIDVAVAAFCALVLLCVPVLLSLQAKSPAEVFRGETNLERSRLPIVLAVSLGASAALGALFLRHAPNPRTGLMMLGATVALFVVFRVAAGLTLRVFERNETRLPVRLRLALAEIAARRETAVISMALAGLSLFLTCLVQFLATDLLRPLGDTRTDGKPNVYMVDVQPSQKEELLSLLVSRTNGAPAYASPMIRARLTKVGEENTLSPSTPADAGAGEGAAGAMGAVGGGRNEENDAASSGATGVAMERDERTRFRQREQNLTYRYDLSDGEEIVEIHGRRDDGLGERALWAAPAGGAKGGIVAEVSLEQEFATRIGAPLGTMLTFDVQGVPVDAKVTSLRKVTWQNFRPNFFIVAHPSLLEGAPQMNLVATSVALPEARAKLQTEVARTFPNVSVIDAGSVVKRVAELASGVAAATRFLASLLLAASLLVLVAGVVATRRTRVRHYAVVRSLGGRDGLLASSLALEFLWLGVASGLPGVVAAALLARVFAKQFLDIDSALSPGPAAALFFSYVVLNVVVGVASCASVLRRKPAEVLREA